MIDGLYLLCLRAFPRQFREAHGREMLQAFRLREADIGGWGPRWRFRTAAMWNVIWNGFAERRRPGRREADAVLGGLLPPRGTLGGGGGMDGWQGCVPAPSLFNICMDWVLGKVTGQSHCGASVSNTVPRLVTLFLLMLL